MVLTQRTCSVVSEIITINGVEITRSQLEKILSLQVWKASALVTTPEATDEVAGLLTETLSRFGTDYPDPEWLERTKRG